jgi:predicted transcriptional regulator
MSTTTIRVSTHTRQLLQELARQSGASMQSVLERALEQYRRQQLLEATNAAYATLQADPAAWAELERERADWDKTLADGLEEA